MINRLELREELLGTILLLPSNVPQRAPFTETDELDIPGSVMNKKPEARSKKPEARASL
ncbi:MAG: hypothetical protein HY820_00430 [Acidobacteria bacterium]|nr:hypothetical protein [Acidobacteriota bacterium]